MEIGIWISNDEERASLAQWVQQCTAHHLVFFRDNRQAHECLKQRQAQLVIASEMDVSLAQVQQWRAQIPETDWILVTGTPSFQWAQEALLSGATGFFALSTSVEQINRVIDLARVERCHRLQAMLGVNIASEIIDLSKPIESALAYIAEHIAEHLTLQIVSRKVYLSPSHFSRLFAQKVAIPFNEYVLARRIDAAKTLLTETGLPIEVIAAKVGIASASHFSQAFKRATGANPRAYRQAFLKTTR